MCLAPGLRPPTHGTSPAGARAVRGWDGAPAGLGAQCGRAQPQHSVPFCSRTRCFLLHFEVFSILFILGINWSVSSPSLLLPRYIQLHMDFRVTLVYASYIYICLRKSSRNPIKTNVPCIPQLPPLPRAVEAPGRGPQDSPTRQQSTLPWAPAAAVGTGGFQALRYQPWDSSAARSDLIGTGWF